MRKRKILTCLVSICTGLAVLILNYGQISKDAFAKVFKGASNTTEYKLVLNVNNQATTAEVGSWNNPGNETNVATRYTELGNPIQLAFASGNGITRNGDATFCQMPGSNNGWFTNTTPLTGIKSIKITTLDTGSQFVIDTSSSTTLSDYSYSSTAPNGVTRTSTYTGSKSYTIDFNGEFNYFRLQNIGSSPLRPTSCEITFNCYSYHVHNNSINYIEHQATPAFRGVDGNIAYKECPLCHQLFDMNGNEITQAQTVEKSNFFEVVGGSTGDTPEENFNFDAAIDDVITVDIYLETPSLGMRVSFRCGNPWTRTVCAKITGDTFEYTQSLSGQTNDGVTYIGRTTDGYYRYEFDLGKMPKEDGFSSVNKISVYKWEHSAGYLDVNTTGGTLLHGTAFKATADSTVDYSTPYSLPGLTVNLDVFFTSGDDTKIYVYFGDGWSAHFGYFSLYPTTKTGDYDGLTVSTTADGYIRYTFHIDSVTILDGSPTKINLFYMWNKYTTASGYFEISFVENSLVHHDAVASFRGENGNAEYYTCPVCGKYFDSSKVATTSNDVIRKSAFFEFDNTTLPKSSTERIKYDIPEDRQLTFGDTFVIDFKLEQIGVNSELGFLIGDSSSNYFGKFWVDSRANEYPRLQNSYGSGITSTFTVDGYLRVSIELDTSKVNSGRQTGADGITKFDYVEIIPGSDYITCTGSLEILPEAGVTTDGTYFMAGKERVIDFPSSSYLKRSTGIVIADFIIFGNDTKVSVKVGNWSKSSGWYNLYATTKTGDYAGVTVSDLENGYKRFIFDLASLTTGTIVDDTEDYKFLCIRGGSGWTTANGFVKVSLLDKNSSPAMEDIY